MNYCVRVNFPDDDCYVYLTHETGINKGKLKIYPTLEMAEADAHRYAGAITIPLRGDDEEDSSRDSRTH